MNSINKLPDWTKASAHFSDNEHRIWLRRNFPTGFGAAVFILHNPSTANHTEEDATSRRGKSFAQAWGCSELVFVNAATGIATNAKDLEHMTDPIGSMADEALEAAAELCERNGGYLIAAWGAPKGTAKVKRMMEARFNEIKTMGLPLHYLRLSKKGYPEHPLYLPGNLIPTPWEY